MVRIKFVLIAKTGFVTVIDRKDRHVYELEGKWKDKMKDIFKAAKHYTQFYDQRFIDISGFNPNEWRLDK